jgi:hypothetical protein
MMKAKERSQLEAYYKALSRGWNHYSTELLFLILEIPEYADLELDPETPMGLFSNFLEMIADP